MVTKMKKLDPSVVYVAWQSGSAELDGVPYSFAEGSRWRGDHPLVRHMGATGFVPDGTPRSEWPTAFDLSIGAAEKAAAKTPPPAPPRISPDTPLSQVMVCTRTILSSAAGSCEAGSFHLVSDPIVRLVPEAFSPVLDALGTLSAPQPVIVTPSPPRFTALD